MNRQLAYRSIPTICETCGRNLAHDDTHITAWNGTTVTFYCTTSCDPRKAARQQTA